MQQGKVQCDLDWARKLEEAERRLTVGSHHTAEQVQGQGGWSHPPFEPLCTHVVELRRSVVHLDVMRYGCDGMGFGSAGV